MTLTTPHHSKRSLILRASSTLGAMVVCWSLAATAPAWGGGPAVLERPTFDRQANVLLVPYKGSRPAFTTEAYDGGIVYYVDFAGSQARLATTYKLGLFHPLVKRVEMEPNNDAERVRLTLYLSQPGRLTIQADARQGVFRLQVVPGAPADALGASAPQPPVPVAAATPDPFVLYAPSPSAPQAGMGAPSLPAALPAALPSAPPVGPGGTFQGGMAPTYAPYRPPVPSPGGAYAEPQMAKPAVAAPELVFKPVAALDSVFGYTLMSEKATDLGMDLSGQGAMLWGAQGHVPMGSEANVNLGAETFAYAVTTQQVPDAKTRRDETFMQASFEYLPVRSPFVLAFGSGYWGRYVQTKTDVLPPPSASLLFQPTMLFHGPTLNARTFIPLWSSIGLAASMTGAPYMMGGSDPLSAQISPQWSYQLNAGLKWGARHASVSAGYRHQGFGAYAGGYGFTRGGPEVSFIWRF